MFATYASGDILHTGSTATTEIEPAFTRCLRRDVAGFTLDLTSCSRRLGEARLLKNHIVLPLPANGRTSDERVAV